MDAIDRLGRIDLNLLVSLYVLLDERNVTRAADRLFITQPAASRTLTRLRDLFDDVVAAASVGAAKPAQAIFDVAVEAGGAGHHETLHVGDHPEADVVGANAAGLKSVWVNRNGDIWPDHLQRPDAIVNDIGELLSILGVGR